PVALAPDPKGRSARGRCHLCGVLHRAVVRAASRSRSRLRLLRYRHAIATENVGGAGTRPRAVRGCAVRLFSFDCAAADAGAVNTSAINSMTKSMRVGAFAFVRGWVRMWKF